MAVMPMGSILIFFTSLRDRVPIGWFSHPVPARADIGPGLHHVGKRDLAVRLRILKGA